MGVTLLIVDLLEGDVYVPLSKGEERDWTLQAAAL